MSVTGQVVLDPGVTTPLGFELMWLSRDLPGPYEMVVMADTDGDGTDEELGSMAVHNADFMAPGGEPVSETGVTPRQLADAMHLELRPNPFNPSTQLSFELAQTAPTTVEILDLRGRVVRTLVAKESFDAGSHSLHWNGRDDRGSVVASGVYQVRVQAGEQVAILKATLLK
jgi:hypothetical protein